MRRIVKLIWYKISIEKLLKTRFSLENMNFRCKIVVSIWENCEICNNKVERQ